MARVGVSELLESLGLLDHGTSGRRTRAVFHYEPLLRLYKLEIPSLFGLLLRDEGKFLDRADPNLFDVELDELLTEFGPLIWPLPAQGPRDHLLDPAEGSRYTADLVYPRDATILKGYLRSMILNKHARPDVDIDALIEKRHKDANLKIFSKPQPGFVEARRSRSRAKLSRTATGGGRTEKSRQVYLIDDSSALSEVTGGSGSDSEDSVVNHDVRKRSRVKSATEPFKVALRLYRQTSPEEFASSGPCHSYGMTFLTADLHLAEDAFAHISQNIEKDCTYMEFHPPEDMSADGRVRIERGSQGADTTFRRVVRMLREARKFPGEPSYRTVEVEVGVDAVQMSERRRKCDNTG